MGRALAKELADHAKTHGFGADIERHGFPFDDEEIVIGAAAFLAERVPGAAALPEVPRGSASPSRARVAQQFGRWLAERLVDQVRHIDEAAFVTKHGLSPDRDQMLAGAASHLAYRVGKIVRSREAHPYDPDWWKQGRQETGGPS